MGKRTRDEVIYSRVDYRVKQEFELQMKESGNKTSADFIDYLLRVNKGRQIDGTTLKQFMEVMNEVCYELKKQYQYQPVSKEYQCLSGFDLDDSI